MACGSRCRPRKDALCCEGGPVLAHSLDVSSIQEHGANHCKLDSSATPIPPVPHREGNRATDGLRPQARTLRPPRRDHDLSRYRHGLRASEVCDLQWHQIELSEGRLHVRRVKNGMPSVHPLTGKELRALRRLQREQWALRVHERARGTVGFRRMLERLGEAAKMAFGVHPHMLRHACGFKLANQGVDTRSLQHYLGHKNIQHTVRYTEVSPDRFRNFWKD